MAIIGWNYYRGVIEHAGDVAVDLRSSEEIDVDVSQWAMISGLLTEMAEPVPTPRWAIFPGR